MSGKRAERLQIMLTQEEVRAVKAWRFDNRMPSRSAAARALMNLGLKTTTGDQGHDAMLEGSVASGDIGVVRTDPTVAAVFDPDARPGVLVVDAELLIGHGIKSLLQDAGYAVVGPATGSDEAISLIKQKPPAAAVLETRLGEDRVEKLADMLSREKIPYLFCTDSDPKKSLPERFWSSPVVSKLSAGTSLGAALASLLD